MADAAETPGERSDLDVMMELGRRQFRLGQDDEWFDVPWIGTALVTLAPLDLLGNDQADDFMAAGKRIGMLQGAAEAGGLIVDWRSLAWEGAVAGTSKLGPTGAAAAGTADTLATLVQAAEVQRPSFEGGFAADREMHIRDVEYLTVGHPERLRILEAYGFVERQGQAPQPPSEASLFRGNVLARHPEYSDLDANINAFTLGVENGKSNSSMEAWTDDLDPKQREG